jgi:hypothetical protein
VHFGYVPHLNNSSHVPADQTSISEGILAWVLTHSRCVALCFASTKVEIVNHSNRHSLGSSIMGNPFKTPTGSLHVFEKNNYDCTSQTKSSRLPTQCDLIACLLMSPRASKV